VNQLSPRRLVIQLRRTSPLDIIATAIVLIYALARIALIFRPTIPFAGFLAFLAFLSAVYLFVRLIPWLRNRFMWTLRNRLIVTYVFIAVVPVILLISMAGLATYGLYLQLGAHLFHDDLQERISTIAADADALAGAVEMEADHGAEPTNESILQRPGVSNLIEAERKEGLSPEEAILKASVLRFRPILMTTVAAIFGALPLMFGTGTGSELRHPLGVSIVGGLLVSQVLTLFTTPVIYLMFDRIAARMRGRLPSSDAARLAEGST